MTENIHTLPAILRLPDVLRTVGVSKTHLYRMVKAGTFPQQIQLSPNVVGWLRSEVDGWLGARASARITQPATLAA